MGREFTYCPRCATALTTTETADDAADGAASRRRCPSCDFIHYENPTPVVAAIVERGDDAVLVRNVGWPETWYGLVTGFLEKAEDPADAVLRELREELGLDGVVVSLVGLYPFAQMNQLIIAYHVQVPADAPITRDPAEIADTKLVPLQKLRPWPFGTGAAVADFLAARAQSTSGAPASEDA